MKKKTLSFSKICLTLILSVFFLHIQAQTLPGSYTTSWIGNTVGTETDHIMQDVSQLYVGPNGYVAAVTSWDEGGHNVMGFDASGILRCDPQDCGTGSWSRNSGVAITYDGTYVYQAMSQGADGSNDNIHYPSSGTWNTIARYAATGGTNSYAPFTNGMGHAEHSIVLNTDGADARGMVAYNNELFVAVGNQIIVYQLPLASQSSKRSWTISDPGQLQVDASGYIWMLQPTNKKIIRYSTTGVLQSQSIILTSFAPTGFGIDKTNNKIYISNNNSAQNVLIYNNIISTPTSNGTFGVTGGILAGSGPTIGTWGPLRFNKPVGVGVDNSGNIYVACDGSGSGGGAVIEKYNSTGTRLWYKYGLEFIDNAEIAPSSETDIFTKEEHFTLNYGNTAVGTEQTYKGYTVNSFKYPQDARIHNALNGGVWVREFNGKRFLFVTDMFSGWLAIYRFNSSTDGETAIPCGFFAKGHLDIEGGTWPANQPANNAWIWNDTNGNGNFDSGEYSTYSSGISSWGWNVDNNGTVWIAEDGTNRVIRKFPCQGLNGNGSPIYNFTSMVNTTGPSIFTEMQRLEYDAANDQMYIGGYTKTNPHVGTAWGRLGREIVRVDNWSTGNRTASKRITLPNDANGDAAIKDISIAGSYIFAASCFYGDIYVYDKSSGAQVGMITPQNIGNVGWADMPACIRAFKRLNGEYIVFNEDDFMSKVVMYRWCPGNCTSSTNIAPAGTGAVWSNMTSATTNNTKSANAGINDNNVSTDISLADVTAAGNWQGAGVTFTAAQSGITSVQYFNGVCNLLAENGVFSAGIKLQQSTNGTTWTNVSGWTISPTYPYNEAASNVTYTFSGAALNNVKGIRVVGQVGTNDSWSIKVKELQVFSIDAPAVMSSGNQLLTSLSAKTDVTENENFIKVYPNPVKGTLHFTYKSIEPGIANVKLYNAFGLEMLSEKVVFTKGVNDLNFDVSKFRSGVYVLYFYNGIKKEVKQFLIND